MCEEIGEGQMARWRKLGARVGCDEKDYKTEPIPGSPVTSTAKAEAEPEVRAGDGDGDGAAEDDTARETGDMVEERAVSEAHASEEMSAS